MRVYARACMSACVIANIYVNVAEPVCVRQRVRTFKRRRARTCLLVLLYASYDTSVFVFAVNYVQDLKRCPSFGQIHLMIRFR